MGAGFDKVVDRRAKWLGDVVGTMVISLAVVSDMVVDCLYDVADTWRVHGLSASDEKGAYC